MDIDRSSMVTIPVEIAHSDMIAAFTNHLTLRSANGLVHMEFAQFFPPEVNSDEEFSALVDKGIDASVVARLVIPEEIFKSFVTDMYQQIVAAQGGDE